MEVRRRPFVLQFVTSLSTFLWQNTVPQRRWWAFCISKSHGVSISSKLLLVFEFKSLDLRLRPTKKKVVFTQRRLGSLFSHWPGHSTKVIEGISSGFF